VLNKFLLNKSGNVAMMFGLFLIPMLVGAGVAIDMLRANLVRGQLIEAADSGLLAAVRAKSLDGTLTDEQAMQLARDYFDANYTQSIGISIDMFDFTTDPATETFRLTITGGIKTSIMGVVGAEELPIDIISEAKYAPGRPLEVVMVLDNTGSMSGQKIDDLKDAAEELVDVLMQDTNNEVLVGLVPFSTHVNIGKSRGSAFWLDIPADSSYDRNQCTVDTPTATAEGCTSTPNTCYNSEGQPYSCPDWSCPDGEPAPTTCGTTTVQTTWEGCVGSRDHPLNVQDADFVTDPVPGVLNNVGVPDCPGEILPMTTEKSDVEDEIAAMGSRGNTYIPGGLTWGLRLISSMEPFTEGETYANIQSEEGVKAIVLMTDGENTKSPSPNGSHYRSNVSEADQYTAELCDEIKAQDIVLYTVAFEITDANTLNMIEDCATDSDSYFNANDADALSAAFESIGASLTELALTR